MNKVLVFPLLKKYKRHAGNVKKAAGACLLFFPTLANTKRGKNTPSESRVGGTTRGYINAEVHIFLIKDEEMRRINRTFRGKDKPTNVLSFEEPKNFPCLRRQAHPEHRAEKGSVKLGEIYLAPDYIERKGENIGHLVIHGILHLLGYTHKGLRDRMEMEKKENEVLGTSLL